MGSLDCKIIYYLKLNTYVSENYLRLAALFRYYDFDLVPTDIKTLKNLDAKQVHYIVCLNTDVSSHIRFSRYFKNYLKFALISKRFYLYDLSSFGPMKLDFLHGQAHLYEYMRLPRDINEVVGKVLKHYHDRMKTQQTKKQTKRRPFVNLGKL